MIYIANNYKLKTQDKFIYLYIIGNSHKALRKFVHAHKANAKNTIVQLFTHK